MDIATLIIQLLSGAVGGNIAGGILKNISLGTIGNSIAGIIGGGIGAQILSSLFNLPVASLTGDLDPMAILTQVAAGGTGGGVTLAVVGLLRSLLQR